MRILDAVRAKRGLRHRRREGRGGRGVARGVVFDLRCDLLRRARLLRLRTAAAQVPAAAIRSVLRVGAAFLNSYFCGKRTELYISLTI